MMLHTWAWPSVPRPENYDELKAKAHEVAAWFESTDMRTTGISVVSTGALVIPWSGVKLLGRGIPRKNIAYAAVLTRMGGKPGHTLYLAGFFPDLDRYNKPARAYFRWLTNPWGFNQGMDWHVGCHMTKKIWEEGQFLTDEKKAKYHPCGPLAQITPWMSDTDIDHLEAYNLKSNEKLAARMHLLWYPFEPHYCHWDEFKDKEFKFEFKGGVA
jgi:hypothetical protein